MHWRHARRGGMCALAWVAWLAGLSLSTKMPASSFTYACRAAGGAEGGAEGGPRDQGWLASGPRALPRLTAFQGGQTTRCLLPGQTPPLKRVAMPDYSQLHPATWLAPLWCVPPHSTSPTHPPTMPPTL